MIFSFLERECDFAIVTDRLWTFQVLKWSQTAGNAHENDEACNAERSTTPLKPEPIVENVHDIFKKAPHKQKNDCTL